MEKEFTDKIEEGEVISLAGKRKGKKMTQQMMDTLECCKQHDGPVTAKDIEKLKSFTESEIIAEAVFSEEDNCTSHQTQKESWIKLCQIYFKVPLSLLIKHRLGGN